MKSAILYCFLLSVTLIEIQGGAVLDENDEKKKAKDQVKARYDKVEVFLKEIKEKYLHQAEDEVKPALHQAFLKSGEDKYKEFLKKFEDEGILALKTAIEKNKPLSAYECVIKVSIDGREELEESFKKYDKKLNETDEDRRKELKNFRLMTDLIKFGLEKAIVDTNLAIDKAQDLKGIEAQKSAGIKKCDNAEAQAKNLKNRILDLKKMEFLYEGALKTTTEKFASIFKSYSSKLQNCVK